MVFMTIWLDTKVYFLWMQYLLHIIFLCEPCFKCKIAGNWLCAKQGGAEKFERRWAGTPIQK